MGIPWRKILIWAGEQAIKLADKKLQEKKQPKPKKP